MTAGPCHVLAALALLAGCASPEKADTGLAFSFDASDDTSVDTSTDSPSLPATCSGAVINEFLAVQETVNADDAGDFDPWIELYNATSTDVPLDRWYATSDFDDPTAWSFSEGAIIAATGWLLVWADAEPREGSSHASFALAEDGGSLGLVREGQAVLVLDENDVLVGLLTGHDFTTYLRRLSEDTLAVADIEATVKQLIQRHFQGGQGLLQEAVLGQIRGQQRSLMGDVRKVVDACLLAGSNSTAPLSNAAYREAFDTHFVGEVNADFDRLNFAQFISVFLSAECWATYEPGFGLPAQSVRRLLDTARDLRNRLAHHRGTLTSTERDRLNFCRDLLNRVADLTEAPQAAEVLVVASSAQGTPPSPSAHDSLPEDEADAVDELTRQLIHTKRDRVVWSFDIVGDLLYGGLPPSALVHRSWWSNDEESAQAQAWLAAERRVVSVNLTERTVTFGRNTARERAYITMFGAIFRQLVESKSWPRKLPSPAGRSWQSIANLPENGAVTARLVLAFATSRRFRVELYIDSGEASTNKAAFDALREHAAELDHETGVELEWERLDEKRACRVAAYFPGGASLDSDEQDFGRLVAWVEQVAPKFHTAMRKFYRRSA